MSQPIVSLPVLCHDCGKAMEAMLQPRFEGGYITLLTCWNPSCLLKGVSLSETQYQRLTEDQFEAYRMVNHTKLRRAMSRRGMPPKVSTWHGPKAPRIRTVQSLAKSISPQIYDSVYWIAKTVDNVILEYDLLTNWYFTDNGQLIGSLPHAQGEIVKIPLEDYIILSPL